MSRFLSAIILLLLPGAQAFQFMANWKIGPPADLELQEKTKAKFGDKSE
jgi:hypothetical protein